MKQEEKEQLLKDLCSRLQYGLKCSIYRVDDFGVGWRDATLNGAVLGEYGYEFYFDDYVCVDSINKVKPYLSPLSSMTDEQKREYNRWKHEIPICHYEYGDVVEEVELFDSPESFEYLIENHFDYRGLIEKGLAIDATGKNIY